jgi:hypothetical protein
MFFNLEHIHVSCIDCQFEVTQCWNTIRQQAFRRPGTPQASGITANMPTTYAYAACVSSNVCLSRSRSSGNLTIDASVPMRHVLAKVPGRVQQPWKTQTFPPDSYIRPRHLSHYTYLLSQKFLTRSLTFQSPVHVTFHPAPSIHPLGSTVHLAQPDNCSQTTVHEASSAICFRRR